MTDRSTPTAVDTDGPDLDDLAQRVARLEQFRKHVLVASAFLASLATYWLLIIGVLAPVLEARSR